MRTFLIILTGCFFMASFTGNKPAEEKYEVFLEAKGCHYQISVNDNIVAEGKSYQKVSKIFEINEKLTENGEQKVGVNMIRISREMTLKSTQAYINLQLKKKIGDSAVLIKEIKLPIFPYDDDENQPHSIGEIIEFERQLKQ